MTGPAPCLRACRGRSRTAVLVRDVARRRSPAGTPTGTARCPRRRRSARPPGRRGTRCSRRAGCARRRRSSPAGARSASPLGRRTPVVGVARGARQLLRRRIDDHLARRAVDDHQLPGLNERARVVQADDRRHLERSREDGGVIRAAAGVGREAAHLGPVDLRGQRRRQLVGDQHRRLVELAQQIARRRHAVAQVHPQPADQVGDVALPLAQVRIGDVVEDRAELVRTPAGRPTRR